ncbi:MAG: hypothetical protein RLZZ500_257 [Bacteroidota bacterium]|jgi:hypothetical protein
MEQGIRKLALPFLVILYFCNGITEVTAEYFCFDQLIYITKPLIPLLLMVLYWFNSTRKDYLFFIIMGLSMITNLLFIPHNAQILFYGVIAYSIHRVFLLFLIIKRIRILHFIPMIVATLPLGFIFFYLFTANELPDNTMYLILFHNILASILGGIAISLYVMEDSKVNSLLLISTLLFLGLQLVIYIEKYYLTEVHSEWMRPLAMSINILAFYTFYKFVLAAESTHSYRSSLRS